MNTYINYLIILMASLLVISCGTDETSPEPGTVTPPMPGINIYSTINGLVFDENNEALVGATISISDNETTSDENGYFTETDYFDSDGTYLKVDYPGYHSAFAILVPLEDQSLTMNVTLKRKDNTSGSSTENNIIQLDEATVTFEPNSFVDLDGNSYSGNVNFTHKNIVPLSVDSERFEIGEHLTGSKLIQSYGIVGMELTGTSGQELQINSSATISMKVPSELLSGAPQEISMYYRDEATGLWIEDGVATLENGSYTGKVSHFTDWMCGIDYEYYILSGKVTRDGDAYSGGRLHFKMEGYYSSSIKLGSDGNYKKFIPDFVGFDIWVFDRCNKQVHEELGQPMMTADRGFNFNVTAASDDISVQGFVYCNNLNDIVDAYVLISVGGSVSVLGGTENGMYAGYFSDCSAEEISVMAFDPTTQTRSEIVTLTELDNQVDLNVCEAPITGSVTIKIDGEDNYVIPGCTLRIDTIPLSGSGTDSTFLEWYYFETTDTFEGNPQGFNQEVHYEIAVITRFVAVPGHPDVPNYAPPAGPLVEPVATPDAPFYFDFISVDFTRVSEDNDHVIFDIQTSKPGWTTAITKYENGVETQLTGTVLVEAFK